MLHEPFSFLSGDMFWTTKQRKTIQVEHNSLTAPMRQRFGVQGGWKMLEAMCRAPEKREQSQDKTPEICIDHVSLWLKYNPCMPRASVLVRVLWRNRINRIYT
jgi:hypothetical protein